MLKVLELFGGIGACTKALKRLNIPHKVVDYVEIDKYAVKSYNAINETNFEPQDITKWDKDIDVDLIMHGSPCQDFSLAGSQAGGDEGSGTRSSLMYETIRIVEKLNPKYVIWENVKNVLSKKHVHNFNQYIDYLTKLGYTSYFKVLNARNYGIPQNRERIFVLSIKNDIDIFYNFPEPLELKIKLNDLLEDEVDEKYYLSEKMKEYIVANNEKWTGNNDKSLINKEVASTINTAEGTRRCDASNYICKGLPNDFDLKLLIKNATKKGYEEGYPGDSVNLTYPNSKTRRGRVGKQVAQTLETQCNQGVILKNLRIRKLTPKECFKLMGFDDIDFENASKVNSNTQLYKQAGNSIVVNVLEGIFKNLLMKDN